MKTKTKKETFLKKYGYYVVLGVSVAALALIVTLASLTGGSGSLSPDNTIDVDTRPVSFVSPVAEINVLKGYSGTELQYNNTLKQWEAHKAVDFSGAAGDDVYAVYDGTVKEVYNNYLQGGVIVLQLKDNITVLYASLNNITLKAGDSVTKGQKIGTVSDSAKSEASDGAHLHLEVYKNNVKVDPGLYLDLTGK